MTPAYEHNDKPVNAQAFYEVACDPRRHVAVEACAGAGKTWMLVSRIVRALLDGAAPQEILAITFTKRAAGEMRERLQQWLAEFSKATPEKLAEELALRGIVKNRGAWPVPDLDLRLKQLHAGLLTSGRPVQIRTFHSWFAALFRNAPFAVLQQLGLPANYELLEDDKEAKAQVWRRFYAALIGQPTLRADFEAVVFEHGRFQSERALQAALDKRLEFGLADAAAVVDASVPQFSVQFPEFAELREPIDVLRLRPVNLQLMQEAAKALGRASAPTFSAKGAELEQALSALPGQGGHAAEPKLFAVLGALLTKEGSARKFGEKIAGIERVRAAQALALQIQDVLRQHAAWVYQQRMARLARLLIAEFATLKRERGWVDMNDVERAASLMLSDAVLAGWLQQRLDAQVKHVLIDEFQDTSPLQWQALFSWLSGYAGAGGGARPSVFIVGDPKQSIYRFRRAEPQVFKAAKNFVRQGLGGDLLSCDHTRRNAPEVIHAVNAVMQEAMSGKFEGDVYDGFRAHTTSSTEPGEVCRLPQVPRGSGSGMDDARLPGQWRDTLTMPQTEAEETLRVREARQAAQWIATRVADGVQPKDIMVLSRRRASLAPLHEALRALQVPSQIGEKTALIDCWEVQDIVALFDMLVSPQHDLSMARVLKSPIFGFDDQTLVSMALRQQSVGEEKGRAWFELLQNRELVTQNLRDLGPVLLQWKRWVDELPPHDALQAIYSQGDVLARFAAAAPAAQRAAVLANLRALPGVALGLGGGRFATPYGFVRALKAGGVQATAAVVDDAVRLLTIHGAKGLEAEVVLLLDSDASPPRAESMGVLIDWPGEAPGPRKFVFLASEKEPPASVAELLTRDLQERKREELNALYVALTRARTQLALSSVEPHKTAPGSWWARLSEWAEPLAVDDGLALADEQGGPSRAQQPITMKVLPAGPDEPQPDGTGGLNDVGRAGSARPLANVLDEPPGGSSRESRIGQAMHRLLEWAQGWDVLSLAPSVASSTVFSPAKLAAASREFGLSKSHMAQAAAMAERILQGEGGWAWDARLLRWQGNEVALHHEGMTLRLDRLVQRRDTGAWWVLDYKSTLVPLADAALVAQLGDYVRAVKALYPDEEVLGGFLTGDGRLVCPDPLAGGQP